MDEQLTFGEFVERRNREAQAFRRMASRSGSSQRARAEAKNRARSGNPAVNPDAKKRRKK